MNGLARVISFVFHPLFMATYLFGLFMLVLPSALAPLPYEQFQSFLVLIVLVTFLLPAVNIFIFKMIGMISSLTMPERRERIVPFIFITIVYCGMTYMFFQRNRVDFSDNFFRFLLIIDMLVVVSLLATIFYKVSVHSLAISGLLGILLPINKIAEQATLLYCTLGVIVVAGLVMSARLQLNAHSPREVLVGSVLGFATGFVAMLIFF